METSPVTCRTLEEFYHIDGHTFEKQYKEVLSGYRRWDQLSHADEWMLFPENMAPEPTLSENIIKLQITDNHILSTMQSKSKSF